MKHKPIIIGVAGGTASGKSTLVRRLQETFVDEDVVVLSHDYYYKAHDELPLEQRAKLNYDHPDAFDTRLMCEQINQLCEGHSVERPVYSFVNHNRIPETVTIDPPCVLIIDGILIFENEELRDLMDVKIYVQTDDDVRLARRIQRDVKERGRSVDSVIEQYLTTDRNSRMNLGAQVQQKNVCDWLLAHADTTDETVEFDKVMSGAF